MHGGGQYIKVSMLFVFIRFIIMNPVYLPTLFLK